MLKTKHAFIKRSGIIMLLLTKFLVQANYLKAQSPGHYNWGSVAVGGGGFVSGIVTEKRAGGKIYARTDVGGAYRYDAAYKKWIPLTDFASDSQQGIFGVESIAIDHSHPNIIYMSAGIPYFNDGKSYILRSADYGDSFSVTEVTSQFKINGNGYGRQDGERLQVDPLNGSVLYCGTRANGLFISKNEGAKWKRLSSLDVSITPNGNGVNFVVLDTTSAGLVNGAKQTLGLFVGVSRSGADNLYWSKDGGASFAPLVNPMLTDKTLMPHRGVLSGGYLYITYSNGAGPGGRPAEPCTTGQVWRYHVATGTWANVSPVIAGVAQAKPYCGLSIDPLNPARIVVSTTNSYSFQYSFNGKGVFGDRIYYTADGGATWADVTANGFSINANGMPWIMGQSIHWAGSVEFDPSGARRVFAVSGNGVFVNNDIAVTPGVWDFAAKGIEETVPQNIISIPDGPIVSVISDYDGFTQADPAQYAPNRHIPSMGSTNGLAYASASKKVVRLSNALYYSNDEGKTWLKATGSLSAPRGQVALSADGRVFLHCPAGSAIIYRSADNGANWYAAIGINTQNAMPVADGLNSDKFYVYDNGNIMLSTDAGQSFKLAGNAGSGGSKIIRTVPGKEGHLWVALLGGGLAHSEDSGKSFKNISKVSYCSAVGIGKAQMPGGYETIFIYGSVKGVLGVYRSTDKGATWQRINDDKHQYGGPGNGQFIQGDMNVFGRVYMSTAGRGIVYGSITNNGP